MGHCTQDDLIDRFGEAEIIQLADRDRDGEIDDADPVVAKAIADATAEIDGWLHGRLTLPDTVPQEVTRRACDVARFLLYDDRASEQVRERYEDALAWMKDVAAGRVLIPGALPPQDEVSLGTVAVVGSEKVFTDEQFAKMV